MSNQKHQLSRICVLGAQGKIEVLVGRPSTTVVGVAIVCHPHPLLGGSAEHKVPVTIARTLQNSGYMTYRPNFRGVGNSEGVHDYGNGESEDILNLVDYICKEHPDTPLLLAGFSFGTYVMLKVARDLKHKNIKLQGVILSGLAVGPVAQGRCYQPEDVDVDSIIIHGAKDNIVPLQSVLDWAEMQKLPVQVIPGSDHFFTGKLDMLATVILDKLALIKLKGG